MKSTSKIAALALSFIAGVAHADSPESFSKVTPRSAGSNVVGLTAMYGTQNLLYSKDGGKTFAALCKAIAAMPGVDSSGRPTMLRPSFDTSIITHDGHFLAGDFYGLWIDDGKGCNWRLAPELEKASVSALAFDPHDPKVIYGMTSTGLEADNGLFRIDDSGEVERIGEQAPMPFYGMRVAPLPGGGIRFYAVGVREQALVMQNDDGSVTVLEQTDAGFPLDDAGFPLSNVSYQPFYVIRHSDDFGETWTSHDLGSMPGFATRLDAIDPSSPDRVVISRRLDNSNRGATAIPDQLLVSEDLGRTFRDWFTVSSNAGVSIMQDGTVFIADRGEGKTGDPRGLWRADSVLDEPVLIADYETWCIDAREDRLEVCTRFDWGTADPDTGEFTKHASFLELGAVHSCDGVDGIDLCRQELCSSHCKHWASAPACAEHYPECAGPEAWSLEDGTMGSEYVDAGTAADATATDDAGSTPIMKKSDGCGCSTLGAPRLDSNAPYLDIFCLSFVLMCAARRALYTRSA